MGAHNKTNHDLGEKIMSRGKTRNDDRLAAFASGGPVGKAGWDDCHPDKIAAVVVGITNLNGAVLFGLSTDGGSHNLTLMLGKNRRTLWFNGDAELDDELDTVIKVISQMEE